VCKLPCLSPRGQWRRIHMERLAETLYVSRACAGTRHDERSHRNLDQAPARACAISCSRGVQGLFRIPPAWPVPFLVSPSATSDGLRARHLLRPRPCLLSPAPSPCAADGARRCTTPPSPPLPARNRSSSSRWPWPAVMTRRLMDPGARISRVLCSRRAWWRMFPVARVAPGAAAGLFVRSGRFAPCSLVIRRPQPRSSAGSRSPNVNPDQRKPRAAPQTSLEPAARRRRRA